MRHAYRSINLFWQAKLRPSLISVIIPASSLFLLFALWLLASATIPQFLLPTPLMTLEETSRVLRSQQFYFHAGRTLQRILYSFVIGFLCSNGLAFASNSWKHIEQFWKPLLILGLSIPSIVAIFIGIVVFGSRGPVAIIMVSFLLIPELYLILFPAYRNLSTELAEMTKAFHISRAVYIRDVAFPQLAPFLITATRVGISVGWKITILAEVFTLSDGIGYQIHYYFNLFSIKGVLAWFTGFALIMIIIEYGILLTLEKAFSLNKK